MSTTNDGGPAFPRPHTVADANDNAFKMGCPGMTLRDYFAAKAMQGIVSDPDLAMGTLQVAEWAYKQADSMMEARNVAQ